MKKKIDDYENEVYINEYKPEFLYYQIKSYLIYQYHAIDLLDEISLFIKLTIEKIYHLYPSCKLKIQINGSKNNFSIVFIPKVEEQQFEVFYNSILDDGSVKQLMNHQNITIEKTRLVELTCKIDFDFSQRLKSSLVDLYSPFCYSSFSFLLIWLILTLFIDITDISTYVLLGWGGINLGFFGFTGKLKNLNLSLFHDLLTEDREKSKSALIVYENNIQAKAGNEGKTEQTLLFNKLIEIEKNIESNTEELSERLLFDFKPLQNHVEKLKEITSFEDDFIKDIQGTGDKIESNSRVLSNLVSSIADKVDKEMSFSRNTTERINRMFDIIKRSLKVSESLYKNSEYILVIIKTIENFSDQVHIASMNAAITSARIGKAGSPFLVVSKEIRKLSENVRKSLQEMKKNADVLQSSITDVIQYINTIYSEMQETYNDLSQLTGKFEGLNLSTNIIEKTIKSNMVNIFEFLDMTFEYTVKNKENQESMLEICELFDMTRIQQFVKKIESLLLYLAKLKNTLQDYYLNELDNN